MTGDIKGKSKTDSVINVALAFCDPGGTYARHAAVVMASIFANTESAVRVYIIHDDTLRAENRDKLLATADSFGQEVRFLNAGSTLDEDVVDVSKLTVGGACGTLFRLLIPQLIDVLEIIYLDCDVVVNLDLKEMSCLDLGGRAVGAALDVWSLDYLKGGKIPWRLNRAWEVMGIGRDSYFNAGVLLMNLDKIRNSYDFLGEVGAFYKKYRKAITLADQDCLNHIFAGDVRFIDEKFNRINAPEGGADENTLASVWHMAGGIKPWALYSRPGVDELYWRYLTMTPFAAAKKDLISVMLKDLSSSEYAHAHSRQCLGRLRKQMTDNIFRAHIWTIPHIFLASIRRRPDGK